MRNKIQVTLEIETSKSFFEIIEDINKVVKAMPKTEKFGPIRILTVSSPQGMTVSFEK